MRTTPYLQPLLPLLVILTILLISCSPQKRLSRLIKHHPELKVIDTLYIRDTIPIPRIQADTLLHIDSLFDTVTFKKDRLKVSVLRLQDTLYLQGKCEADTIFVDRKIPVERIITVKPDRFGQLISRIPWLVIGLISIILLILFLIIRFR